MSDAFDDDACWERYRALLAARPELARNFGDGTHEILTDPAAVAEARARAARYRQGHDLPVGETRIGVLADDPYLTVLREAVRFPDGGSGTYYRLLPPDAVVVLPLLGPDLVLVKHFRHGTRRWHYEFPRGVGNGVPSWEDDVRRELDEEIGAAAGEIAYLGDIHTSNGISAEYMRLYVARIDAIGAVDRHEGIAEAVAMPAAKVEAMIRANELTDAPTQACFLQARLHGWV